MLLIQYYLFDVLKVNHLYIEKDFEVDLNLVQLMLILNQWIESMMNINQN